MIVAEQSPIAGVEIEAFLTNKELNFTETLNKEAAYKNADYIIIATPADYDIENNYFNISTVEPVMKNVMAINRSAVMVIKLTVPVGHAARIKEELECENIILYQESLGEVKALHANLNTSRIIIGERLVGIGTFTSLQVYKYRHH